MLAGHSSEYIRLLWLVASGAGAVVLIALVVVYRRAVRRSEIEHAERVIAEHDRSSDDSRRT